MPSKYVAPCLCWDPAPEAKILGLSIADTRERCGSKCILVGDLGKYVDLIGNVSHNMVVGSIDTEKSKGSRGG